MSNDANTVNVTDGQQVCVQASGTAFLCNNDSFRNFCPMTASGDDSVCAAAGRGCCGSLICGALLGQVDFRPTLRDRAGSVLHGSRIRSARPHRQ